MKNQTDLISKMAALMDKIETGSVSVDQAKAITAAADVIVQVMKTECALYAASEGVLEPSFIRGADSVVRVSNDRTERMKRLDRA